MKGLRVVFMGTPDFVLPVAEATADLAGEVVGVYTAPDRPAGRGRKLVASPVKEWATKRRFPVLTPERLSPPEERERFEAMSADLVVLAAYGLLLPKTYLFTPPHGAVNVHPSLLPKYRGAAPVAGAILAGDEITGTTLMVMDEGMDTGPILARQEVPLQGNERVPELTRRLFELGAGLLREALPAYVSGTLHPRPQPEEGASVVKRFRKEDGVLDWTRPAVELERRVRALDPWPGTATRWNGKRLEVLEAVVEGYDGDAPPGTVVPVGRGAGVATGEGLLVLKRVKLEGRPAATIEDFLRGHGALIGAVLPS